MKKVEAGGERSYFSQALASSEAIIGKLTDIINWTIWTLCDRTVSVFDRFFV